MLFKPPSLWCFVWEPRQTNVHTDLPACLEGPETASLALFGDWPVSPNVLS